MRKIRKSVIILMILTSWGWADCPKSLQLCDDYVARLEKERDGIKRILDDQTKRVVEAESKVSTVTWYEWVLIGAAGMVIVERLQERK